MKIEQVSNDPSPVRMDARRSAQRAAERADVTVRSLTSLADCSACEQLLAEVWRTPQDSPPLSADVIRAMSDGGSYAAGAFEGEGGAEHLVGACLAWWSAPQRAELHSHIAGIRGSHHGRAVGYALKLDQRAHALERGVSSVTWTFDPLIARNAHFNIRKLGATASSYLVDHYGRLPDGVNGDDESDRLLARWDLADERTVAACDQGRPQTRWGIPRPMLDIDDDRPVLRGGGGPIVLVCVPRDIEHLRRENPNVARDWRRAVRDVLGGLIDGGAHLVDFDRRLGGYVLETAAA
ncbi:GNAT family N-acetyltransferase [Microbacterium marinilacus]|uniref:GNAT family N-acetyltransferase n=1 Tax=Microbacterium marinilacus TaxID=415209 RepID=UPI001C8D0C54|nr:GNAT family N-acetyltransferase [Microbacterium marinilacus]MBY0690366.1 GNAT family N-acetyltransferase [Microbacterium marinilacus]